jgi:CubicO group peptidase (beta-lactamase class C family)
MTYIILWFFIIIILTILLYENIYNRKYKYVEYKNDKLIVYNNIDNDKLDKDSEFLIGSITKIFIIYTILLLQQDKLLNINDNIDKYIDSSDINDFYNITILELINHTAGIKTMPNIINYKNNINIFIPNNFIVNKYSTALSILPFFIQEKLFTIKYGEYNYSNIGYVLLGIIIEKVSKQSYLNTLKKYIIEPLNLTHTNVGNTNIKLYNKYYEPIQSTEFAKRYLAASSGSLYSTINDLINFSTNSIKLLNENSINILKQLYIYKFEDNHHIIKHNGKITGGNSTLKIKYNSSWNVMDIYIKLQTIYD